MLNTSYVRLSIAVQLLKTQNSHSRSLRRSNAGCACLRRACRDRERRLLLLYHHLRTCHNTRVSSIPSSPPLAHQRHQNQDDRPHRAHPSSSQSPALSFQLPPQRDPLVHAHRELDLRSIHNTSHSLRKSRLYRARTHSRRLPASPAPRQHTTPPRLRVLVQSH